MGRCGQEVGGGKGGCSDIELLDVRGYILNDMEKRKLILSGVEDLNAVDSARFDRHLYRYPSPISHYQTNISPMQYTQVGILIACNVIGKKNRRVITECQTHANANAHTPRLVAAHTPPKVAAGLKSGQSPICCHSNSNEAQNRAFPSKDGGLTLPTHRAQPLGAL